MSVVKKSIPYGTWLFSISNMYDISVTSYLFHYNVTFAWWLQMNMHKQRSLYNLHTHYWVIQYNSFTFILILSSCIRAVEGLECSLDVALKLSEGNPCILMEVTGLLLYKIVTWINKTTLSLSCCDEWYNHNHLWDVTQKSLISLQKKIKKNKN